MNADGSVLWKCRDTELEKDQLPSWKVAGMRRDNMLQLFNEMVTGELEYDAFSFLYGNEMKLYASTVDGRESSQSSEDSLQEKVKQLVPNYGQNLKKLSSGLDAKKLLETDNLKAAIEDSKLLSEPIKNEVKSCGNFIVSSKKVPSLKQKVKSTENISNPQSKASSSTTRETVGSKTRWGIYQAIPDDDEPMIEAKKPSKSNFFEEKLKQKKRKFTVQKEVSSDEEMEVEPERRNPFKSAREQLEIDRKKNRHKSPQGTSGMSGQGVIKKSLGARPRNGCFAKFVPPTNKDSRQDDRGNASSRRNGNAANSENDADIDPRLKGIEPKIVELVTNEIMDHGPPVGWDDIAVILAFVVRYLVKDMVSFGRDGVTGHHEFEYSTGLEFAKTTIKEIVIWPMLRPDIFTGLRGPPKGILLFGPPGTGKTLIGKCIASQSGATFFSISASSLTSKWVGEGEKMVRALFAVASCNQPAVIFIDEIDSLLAQRSDSEHESSRRIKTEFLVQLDGAATSSDERILVVGATNRPQEIDEAARRRLSKRLYIPLPGADARKQIVRSLLEQQSCQLADEETSQIISETDGYSGADMANLCREAALGPIRSLQGMDISAISKDDVRPIILEDFTKALQRVRPSVSTKDLVLFEEWNKQFGCCGF